MRYAVIVCPKCRQHAQITETGKKTLKCQHCGALLQTRKLKVFHFSEDLEDAVIFRTHLQAEISGKVNENFSLISPPKKYETSIFEAETPVKKLKLPEKSLSNPSPVKKLKLPEKSLSNPSPVKKDPKSTLIEILNTTGGKIEKQELRQKALEKGITQEKFETILKNLLEAGELYSPQPGIIKIVGRI